jgi:hypothetical protein
MITALLADVVLTPALIHWVKPWTASRDSAAAAAAATVAAGPPPAPSSAARAPAAGRATPTKALSPGNERPARAVQGEPSATAAGEAASGGVKTAAADERDAPAGADPAAGAGVDPAARTDDARTDPIEGDAAAKTDRAPER